SRRDRRGCLPRAGVRSSRCSWAQGTPSLPQGDMRPSCRRCKIRTAGLGMANQGDQEGERPQMNNRSVRRLLPAIVLFLGLGAGPAQSQVVISQVYGGGGNSGAPYTNDYVELFNRGSLPVPLAGLSVQYTSATGTGNFGANPGQIVVLPDATLDPGQYFLVSLAGGTNGSPLPAPDATGTINMAAGASKVALVNSTTGLGCNGGSTPCTPEQLALIVDLVG